jgi:hypothetical protein
MWVEAMIELTQESRKSLAQLQLLLRWRNTLLWVIVPGAFLAGWASNAFHSNWLLLSYVCAWVIAFAVIRQRVRTWPCPFCGEPVLKRADFYGNFGSTCLYCRRSLMKFRV